MKNAAKTVKYGQEEKPLRRRPVKTFGDGYHGGSGPAGCCLAMDARRGKLKKEGIPMEKVNTNDMPNEYIMRILRAAVKMSPEELRDFTALAQQVLQEQQADQAQSA